MLKTNEELLVEDLIRPLSLEALEYFASGAIPVAKSYESPLHCKFIRLGGAVMLGSAIDFGKESWSGQKSSILHRHLLDHLEVDEEAYAIAKAAADKEPFAAGGRYKAVFNDGGYAYIRATDTVPSELVLTGASYDFGRADEAGRQRSVEVAQKLVGDTVLVSAQE